MNKTLNNIQDFETEQQYLDTNFFEKHEDNSLGRQSDYYESQLMLPPFMPNVNPYNNHIKIPIGRPYMNDSYKRSNSYNQQRENDLKWSKVYYNNQEHKLPSIDTRYDFYESHQIEIPKIVSFPEYRRVKEYQDHDIETNNNYDHHYPKIVNKHSQDYFSAHSISGPKHAIMDNPPSEYPSLFINPYLSNSQNSHANNKLSPKSTNFKTPEKQLINNKPISQNYEIHDMSDEMSPLDSSDESETQGSTPKHQKMSRKQFRETVGLQLHNDLVSEKYSYEEIISKYKSLYPEYASKFTKNFCSKVRCGRILVVDGNKPRSVKGGDPRMKRINKISSRRIWTKMTPRLFSQIYDWEQKQTQPVKQLDIETLFNVNRSTYYRWKTRFLSTNNQSADPDD